MFKSCQEICNSYNPIGKYTDWDLDHSRSERRFTYVFHSKDYLDNHLPKRWRPLIHSVICVVRDRTVYKSKQKPFNTTREYSYFISSGEITAKKAHEAIRSHWKIENTLNHVRDVTLEEDKSRIRVNPLNMATLRSFTLNLLRKNKTTNIRQTLYQNSLNIHLALKYIQP